MAEEQSRGLVITAGASSTPLTLVPAERLHAAEQAHRAFAHRCNRTMGRLLNERDEARELLALALTCGLAECDQLRALVSELKAENAQLRAEARHG